MTLNDREERTLAQALHVLGTDVRDLMVLLRQDMEKVAVGVVSRDASTSKLMQAAGRIESVAAVLQVWSKDVDNRLDAHHDTQVRGLLEAIIAKRSEGEVAVEVPLGARRIRLSADVGGIATRIVTVVITALLAWATGAAVGANHASEEIVKQVSK